MRLLRIHDSNVCLVMFFLFRFDDYFCDYRMVEPSPGSSVVVDGEDVLLMGLQDLRRRLAIIPQDPTLFEGTVR